MCGIVGIYNLDGGQIVPNQLRTMTRQLKHRGPNAEDIFVDSQASLGFGHRRLSILDLSENGRQPMSSADGNFVVTFNGEIYNFRELRSELQSAGYHFHSTSDTEVLLYAYAHWGVECFARFDGMFALGIWDKKKKELTIARDRYGVKPLYITKVGSTILFASEIKAFFPYDAFPIELDTDSLVEYLAFQNFFSERTLFKGVNIVPAGSFVQISPKTGTSLDFKQFWSFAFDPASFRDTPEQAEEKLAFLFERGVQKQLVSDVDIGSYLSGGIDSGSITGIAAKNLHYLQTFTCGFDLSSASGIELNFDERRVAERMSYLFKTEHYEIVLKAGDMERCMDDLTWHLEEPRVGQSYPMFYASKLASKFVKVCLSGAGGDELFAGYPWRYFRASQNQSFDEYVDHYFNFWQRMLPGDSLEKVAAPLLNVGAVRQPKEIFRTVLSQIPGEISTPEDYVNRSLCFEAKTFLHGLLVIEDKLSMAHGLETRVPFLDNDLVDYAMTIPVGLKLGDTVSGQRINENELMSKSSKFFNDAGGKLILRNVMRRFVPTDVTERQKQGFSAPDASWFKGESIEFVRRKIFSPDSRIYSYLDFASTMPLVMEHIEGRVNRRLLIWSLLYLETFLEQFIDRPRHELIVEMIA
jgi:asparagine synthase (glutamine-hydrolysing)